MSLKSICLLIHLPVIAATLWGQNSSLAAKSDATPVYAKMSASSALLATLKQGQSVTLVFSLATTEGNWCNVQVSEPIIGSGYVPCQLLERRASPHVARWNDLLPNQPVAPAPPLLKPAEPEGRAAEAVAAALPLPIAPPVPHTKIATPSTAPVSAEQSALFGAARSGNVAAIQFTLAHGIHVDVRDKDGRTPLMWAAYMGQTAAIEELLGQWADMEIKDNLGWTALAAAAWMRHIPAVQMLLEQGADVNTKDGEGRTPLMYAAIHGDALLVQTLLAKDAEVDARNRFEQTPLMLAVSNRDPAAEQILLEAGAQVNARDAAGRSVLMNAALAGGEQAANVQLLLEHGADLTIKDKEGRTALMWAARRGHAKIVQILKKAGATG